MSSRVFRHTPRSFLRAERAGVFGNRRVEMIEGKLYVMGTNPPHITTVIRLLGLLMDVFPRDRWTVADEKMIRVGRSFPIPDLIVLRGSVSTFDARSITPNDIHLLVEVCDSSWSKDVKEKLPVYARAGIPECWLVRLRKRCVYRHTGPTPEGYGQCVVFEEGDLLPVGGTTVRVGDFLPGHA